MGREREASGGRAGVNESGGDVEGVQVTTAAFAATPAMGEVRLTGQAMRVIRETDLVMNPVK
jgi:hypothetical protein